ncbi:hypothetical protein [Roseomonas marmotae]|uniref:Uncharacterized protein n=1 Tax=Roseomonas marmotae TaxID=2768161 RepID=A0ABS3KFA7_9PROT|nr:hypothetical protein [Roseomonas marmotae]MBO1076107.1 hypothetical protein [Roseomonas marmotae]QTI81343.1 hypothetical protein IAI58_18485 [Roseomonas marmotae]
MESGAGEPSFAALALRLRAELQGILSPLARQWLEAPPLESPGRPSRLPGDTPEEVQRPEGRGPREWRIYGRRRQDPQAPFLLRAVLPEARPFAGLVDGAFRTLLHRPPDPALRAAYGAELDSGRLSVGLLLREIAASAEARSREEQIRLVCAPIP